MSDWAGRTAVVTGGGRGVGKAFATALAAMGTHVVPVDFDGAAAAIGASGGSAEGHAGDVADEARMADVMAQAAKANGSIRVNAVSPGLILTDTIQDEVPPQTRARVKAMQPSQADGEEWHIVDAMLFLVSDRSESITGEVQRVSGGMAAGV